MKGKGQESDHEKEWECLVSKREEIEEGDRLEEGKWREKGK
jgi:hypothetical protein